MIAQVWWEVSPLNFRHSLPEGQSGQFILDGLELSIVGSGLETLRKFEEPPLLCLSRLQSCFDQGFNDPICTSLFVPRQFLHFGVNLTTQGDTASHYFPGSVSRCHAVQYTPLSTILHHLCEAVNVALRTPGSLVRSSGDAATLGRLHRYRPPLPCFTNYYVPLPNLEHLQHAKRVPTK